MKTPEELAKEKEEAIAKAKSGSELSADKSGLTVDEDVDVSDEALKRARLASLEADEDDDDKVNDEGTTQNKDKDKDDEEELSDEGTQLDDVSQAILETFKQKEISQKKEQTVEEKLAEYQRKNEKLYKENQELRTNPKPEYHEEPKKPVSKEEYAAWVSKEFDGMDMDEFDRNMKIQHRFYSEMVAPRFKAVEEVQKKSELLRSLGNNKLYNALKSRIDELIKTDKRLLGLSFETASSLAFDIAQKEKLPEIAAQVANKAKHQALARKRVIPKNDSSVGKELSKSEDDFAEFTQEDFAFMKTRDISKEDLKKYSGKLELK